MNDDIDFFHIPDFLDRSLWTKEQWKEHSDQWESLGREDRDRIAKEREATKHATKVLMDEKRAKVAKKEANAQQKVTRKQKKDRSAYVMRKVVETLKTYECTVNTLRKSTGIPAKEIQSALRKLTERGTITKQKSSYRLS